MFGFGKDSSKLVGVDITSTSVKLLELGKRYGAYSVEACAIVPLPKGAVREKLIYDVEAVGSAVRLAVQDSGTSAKQAAVAVAGSQVISKTVSLSGNLSEDEMESRIQMDIDQYVPYSLEEVNMDFQVLGPDQTTRGNVDVLLTVSKSEGVQDRVTALELGGLKAVVVDTEPYATYRMFKELRAGISGLSPDEVVAVIDIGATMSSLNVFVGDDLVYSRDQVFGGRNLTEEIMSRYGLSYEDAGRAKRRGGLPDTYEPEVLEPFKRLLVQQINRFLQFFFSASGHDRVAHLALAGGCASLPEIDQFVEQHTGVSCSVIDPLAEMEVASQVPRKELIADATSMLIVSGLALRRFVK